MTRPMKSPDGKEIPPTGKPFDLDSYTVALWNDGQLVEENLIVRSGHLPQANRARLIPRGHHGRRRTSEGLQKTDAPRAAARSSVFGASLRDASLNAKLAELAARALEEAGAIVDRAKLRDFDAPSYDGTMRWQAESPKARTRSAVGSRPTTRSSSRHPSTMAPGAERSRTSSTGRPAFGHSPSTADTGCAYSRHPRWQAATAGCGRSACRSNSWGRGSSRTCPRSRPPTVH
jgi:hypothetical protein